MHKKSGVKQDYGVLLENKIKVQPKVQLKVQIEVRTKARKQPKA